MSFTLGQLADDVNSLLCKWPRRGYHRQSLGWKALDIPKSLALVAVLDELPCIHLHSRPKITSFDDLTYQGPGARMVSAHPFINLFQNVLGFLLIYVLQVGYGKAPLVQDVIQYRESGCSLLDLPGLFDVSWKMVVFEE